MELKNRRLPEKSLPHEQLVGEPGLLRTYPDPGASFLPPFRFCQLKSEKAAGCQVQQLLCRAACTPGAAEKKGRSNHLPASLRLLWELPLTPPAEEDEEEAAISLRPSLEEQKGSKADLEALVFPDCPACVGEAARARCMNALHAPAARTVAVTCHTTRWHPETEGAQTEKVLLPDKAWKLVGLPVPVLHPACSHATPDSQQLLSESLQMCFYFRNTASDLNRQWLSIRLHVQHKPGRLSHTLFLALLLKGIGCTVCHDGVLKTCDIPLQ